jgi:hypothetical protein
MTVGDTNQDPMEITAARFRASAVAFETFPRNKPDYHVENRGIFTALRSGAISAGRRVPED